MSKTNFKSTAFARTVAAVSLLAAASLPGMAAAHGTMESPISRVYACYLENPESPSSPACIAAAAANKQALYDWNGVRIGDVNGQHRARIPDGQLCGAGDATFSALNAARADWPSSTITPSADGKLDMSFIATASHATAYYRLYITGEGYDPNVPLTWNTLGDQPFCELTGDEIVQNGGRVALSCPFPAGRTGRHLIYAIWQRSDSPEAFYSCSDVVVNETPGEPPVTPVQDLGAVIANADLEAGSTVTFRLFNAAGNDVDTIDVTVDETTGPRAEWPFLLATQVNAQSTVAEIGIRDTAGIVTPARSATDNHVFVTADGSHSFVIDVTAPAPDPTPPPEPVPGGAWSAETVYLAGDLVTYQAVEYQAKWWTQGNRPDASAPWKRITPVTGPLVWNTGAIYVAGDEVVFEGTTYRAKWWTQGDVPTSSVVWEAGG